MGRPRRVSTGGIVYHVLNRSNHRLPLFEHDGDFSDFEAILEQVCADSPMRVLAYCVMPNHWHMMLWPHQDGELSRFVARLTTIHTHRRQSYLRSIGDGHLYRGRFRSFPVQDDRHFLTVCRYVEQNPLRAKLVHRAEKWQWCSLWRRESGDARRRGLLFEWPVDRPSDWLDLVNTPQPDRQVQQVRKSIVLDQPFGGPDWVSRMTELYGLERRRRGRPRKK